MEKPLQIFAFGKFELDQALAELRHAGERVSVDPKPLDVLAFLLENRNRVVSKSELLEHCWPDVTVAEDSLFRAMSELRKVLSEDGTETEWIETIKKRGYRFTGDVQVRPHEPSHLEPRQNEAAFLKSMLPPRPRQIVARERDVAAIRQRLDGPAPEQRRVVIHGWPGVGKTTLTQLIAHDPALERALPDGTLWCSLGQAPDTASVLKSWCRSVGFGEAELARLTTEQMTYRLSHVLRDRRVLLIIDDAWSAADVRPLCVGGARSSTLVTTRLPALADDLASGDEVYRLDLLDTEAGIALLRTLIPNVVRAHAAACAALVDALEGLPLALQVAGRLLRREERRGLTIKDLVIDLTRDLRPLRASTLPADLSLGPARNVQALLALSTDTLDPLTRERFAMLGPLMPKPAIFPADAARAAWDTEEPGATLGELVDRGLLEVAHPGTYQMHALLADHARSLLDALG